MRRPLKSLMLAAGLLLSACAGNPLPGHDPQTTAVLDDTVFAAARVEHDPAAIMALSPEMRRYLGAAIPARTRTRGPVYGLVDALYSNDQLRMGYDGGATHTAAEAFRERRGDCMSLVLMTAAFAREMGLEVRFQHVLADDVAVPDGDLVRMVGHVNIGLAKRGVARVQDWVTVDFLPPEDARRLRFEPIGVERVEAMYFNNKAVESLAAGELGPAYWWARASIARDAAFASAYITLGVLWDRAQHQGLAQAAFAQALVLDAGNPNVLANLQLAEARRSSTLPPATTVSVRADGGTRRDVLALLKAGRFAEARQQLQDALHRRDEADLHLLLAAAYSGLDEPGLAALELQAARRDGTFDTPARAALDAKISALAATLRPR